MSKKVAVVVLWTHCAPTCEGINRQTGALEPNVDEKVSFTVPFEPNVPVKLVSAWITPAVSVLPV